MTETPFEQVLRDRLKAAASHAQPATILGSATSKPVPDIRPHEPRIPHLRAWSLGAAAAVIAIAVIGLAVFREDSPGAVATDTTPEDPSPEDLASELVEWPGVGPEWSALPPGPVDGRTFPVTAWTDAELIVWGGETISETEWANDGAAFNPVSNSWRVLAASPLSPRSEHVAVWTGTELIVCCGRAPSGDGARAAAYDPAADRWRELASPPFEASLAAAIWTGSEMVVAGGVELGGARAHSGAWAYSPELDVWRELASPPQQIERSADVAWTGTKMVVWPGVFGSTTGLTYEPLTDTWARLPLLPEPVWGGSMVWTGDEIVVWGNSKATDSDAVGARITLGAQAWTPIADDPLDPFRWWEGVPGSNRALWNGTEMIVWAGAMGEVEGSTRTLAYNPDDDSWRELATAPITAFGPDLIWTGDVALTRTTPMLVLRPTSLPSSSPTNHDDENTILGALPNGDRYEVGSLPPLDGRVAGISAGIIVDLADGQAPLQGPVVGIANFQRTTSGDQTGVSDDGRVVQVVSGDWLLTLSIDEHVIDELGESTGQTISEAIVPIEPVDPSGLPAFDLRPPLR